MNTKLESLYSWGWGQGQFAVPRVPWGLTYI